MPFAYEGSEGQGHTGYSKYDPTNAPVVKNGGNEAKHDHIVTATSSGKEAYKVGSYGKDGPAA